MASAPLPTITSAPPQVDKRHFFECGDLTLSWEQEWYTAPFFLSSRSSYDRAASKGAAQPPLDICRTVAACQRELGITVESTITTTTNGDGVAIWTTETRVSTTRSGLITATPTSTSPSSTGSTSSSITTSRTGISTTSASIQPSTSSTSTSISSSSSISPSSTSATPDPSAFPSPLALTSVNTCAGDWDWQAWGVVANLGFGLIVGLLLWATWAILRSRMPGFYSPRTWSVPQDSRPSRPWSFLAFLIPFAHMPSLSSTAPLSSAALAQRTMFTGLTLAALSSFVALGAVLPMFLVKAPCLGETSPQNYLGGRLGALTDLSLLRLLNALDPSPDSEATSDFLHIPIQLRALSSTISPAISSARIRLIIILVLITVISVFGGLFAIARAYSALSKYRKNFTEQICGGLSMVFIPSKHAAGWNGLTEEKIKIWLREREVPQNGDDRKELEVVGVFAVPDIAALRDKVDARATALDRLEVAEARFIRHRDEPEPPMKLGPLDPGSKSSRTTGGEVPSLGFTSRPGGGIEPIEEEKPHPSVDPAFQTPVPQRPNTEETGTRFLEINRDSAQFGRRFRIGQRIRVDEQGMYVPASSPSSSDEDGRLSGEGLLSATTISSAGRSTESFHTPPQSAIPFHTPPQSAIPTSPLATVPPPSAGLQAERNRHEEFDAEISACRTEFKALNAEIEVLQQDTFSGLSSGQAVMGWTVVGRGVEWLDHAEAIEGHTKEDILWQNANRSNGERRYFVKVALLGFVLFVLAIPFLGLTVATAPGFAHYLTLLAPLRDSDGFWTGVVEALVPAFVLSHLLMAAVLATQRMSRQIHSISASRQRALAYKATFCLLLSVATILPLTIAALEFAAQGLTEDLQPTKSVGDGAAFYTWFAFVVLLNMAIIVPGLLLLQPLRLIRYMISGRSATTPRRNFRRRQAPDFHPSIALAPTLVAVFYAAALLFIFPLLAIPILILLYLSFVVVHHQVEYLHAPSKGYEAATLALWTIRRFGWVLALQPLIYGLIVLSRREWEIGGISIGVAVVTVIISELVTAGLHPSPKRNKLSASTQKSLDDISHAMRHPPVPAQLTRAISGSSSQILRSRQSTSSMLRRLTTLLPGLSRLPPECPLPLTTHIIHDLDSTELASRTRPDLADEEQKWQVEGNRGLIYPPEMTCEIPIIWLPHDRHGISGIELNDLASNHGLEAIIDPPKRQSGNDDDRRGEKEVRTPLIP